MNIAFQRKIDRIVGTFICRILSLFYRKRSEVQTPVTADRILVILLSEMGSLVLAHPMLQRIKNKFPETSLYFLVFEKNREIVEILDVTETDNILTISNDSMLKFVKDSVAVITKMRKLKFDVVIDCELFARVSSILSLLSGAPIRVGFHPYTQEGLYRGNFINVPVMYNPYHHISKQFIGFADAIDSVTVPTSKYAMTDNDLKAPLAKVGQEEISRMRTRVHNDFPEIKDKKLVLVYPTGGLLSIRAWPLDYFCQLSLDLLQKGYAVGVIGLEEDKKLAEAIQSHCQDPCCVDLTGYTRSIRELMILYHLAALLVANDGGPAHFATMTPLPTIILFGPETPELYGPLNEAAVSFHVPISCSPCLTAYNHQTSPCDGDNLCLKLIHPEQVLAKALEILESQESAKFASV
jgi:ADP-heptose:LPS heptosyltransferase